MQLIAPDDLPYFITGSMNVTAANDISKHLKAAEVKLAFIDTPYRLNQEILPVSVHLDDLKTNVVGWPGSIQI